MTDSRTRSAPRLRRLAVVVLASGAFLVGACGDGEPTGSDDTVAGPGDGPAGSVQIERSRFEPLEVTIDAGGTVEFVNNDPYDHTVTSADGSAVEFDSGPFGEGRSFTQTFDDAGSYDYFCTIHPTMRATVVVE